MGGAYYVSGVYYDGILFLSFSAVSAISMYHFSLPVSGRGEAALIIHSQ